MLHMTEPQGMACRDLCGQYLCDAVTAGVLHELSCLLRLRPALLCCAHPGSPCLHACNNLTYMTHPVSHMLQTMSEATYC